MSSFPFNHVKLLSACCLFCPGQQVLTGELAQQLRISPMVNVTDM